MMMMTMMMAMVMMMTMVMMMMMLVMMSLQGWYSEPRGNQETGAGISIPITGCEATTTPTTPCTTTDDDNG
eukprot:5535795-Karenia_brevis.AAC.1